MNVVLAVKQYINAMIRDSGPGMKVLLMDKETTSIVSMVYSQSEILQKEVYLFELLSNPSRETMKHLNAICFLRPTAENISNLCDELKSTKYSSYFIYFSNRLKEDDIKTLAQSDEHESVKEIKEFYGDFIAVGQHLFSFNIPISSQRENSEWLDGVFPRVAHGISALLLALRKRPFIRYTQSSQNTKKLAEYIDTFMAKNQTLFTFACDVPPLLLILDRRDDPITPLLSQWTYQAMVHELLGIHNHRVDLSKAPGISRELHEVVMSPEQDEFYRENMYLNFGDIGTNIKDLMEQYQEKSASRQQIESIADMKKFVENFPEFRKLSGTVSKHVAVVSEMSRIVREHHMMELSETEQDIATQGEKRVIMETLERLCDNPRSRPEDCLRLGLLFAIRYERDVGDVERVKSKLAASKGLKEDQMACFGLISKYSNRSLRSVDLFEDRNPLAITKRFLRGLKDVENVFTRHKPLLADLLDQLFKGKLKENVFPFTGSTKPVDRPQDVIVFMVGGITYEEAMAVSMLNKTTPGVRVVLGGTTVHNSHSFLEEVVSSMTYAGTANA